MSLDQEIQNAEERRASHLVHTLFVCSKLNSAQAFFKRADDSVQCDHAVSAERALELIAEHGKSRPYDCVVVDTRNAGDASAREVVAIATLAVCRKLFVIAAKDHAAEFEQLDGVDRVLIKPVQNLDIAELVANALENDGSGATIAEAVDPFEGAGVSSSTDVRGRIELAVAALETLKTSEPDDDVTDEAPVEAPKTDTVSSGFETTLSKVQDVDNQVWQRFVPLANFLYKKLAIIVLTALFLTFVVYGAMIIFFIGNSSWSLPFELSRGHILVEKVERDLSSLRLRSNEIKQNLTISNMEVAKAARDKRDGELQLTLTRRTVEEEIILQTAQRVDYIEHVNRLKTVINDFNELNGKGGFTRNLQTAYSKRLITRKALNSGTLAVLETLHRVATVQNEIAVKQMEIHNVERRLEFLRSLLEEINQPEVRVITSAGTSLAHLATEVITSKTLIANSIVAHDAALKRTTRLENSLGVLTANIDSLEATPAARAMSEPVMVLFVPYSNTDNMETGTPLYSCALSIVICSRVGEVGPAIKGETTSIHPLFGKPMRGTFMEARFHDPRSVTKELMHAGSPPMRF